MAKNPRSLRVLDNRLGSTEHSVVMVWVVISITARYTDSQSLLASFLVPNPSVINCVFKS